VEIIRAAALAVIFITATTLVVTAYSNAEHTYTIPYAAGHTVPYRTLDHCNAVTAVVGPNCYDNGVRQCKIGNTGFCFDECVQRVMNVCYDRVKGIPSKVLPPGFETPFRTPQDCKNALSDFCQSDTNCYMHYAPRCARIGKIIL
jgi:hypothetical protein